MSLRHSLVGFGVSAAMAISGFYSLAESAEHSNNSSSTEIAALKESERELKEAYGGLGLVALAGAGVGTFASFVLLYKSEEREESTIGGSETVAP
jgi:divalent metal cation (Fe/Co/Zn/Cd) transporter